MTDSAGTRLRAWLARPYPLWQGAWRETRFAVLATLAAAALLHVMQPFGLDALPPSDATALVAQLGAAGLAALLVLRVAALGWLERRWDESRWTAGRQVAWGILEIVVLAGVVVSVLAWNGHIDFNARRARNLTALAMLLALVPVIVRTAWYERALRTRNARTAAALSPPADAPAAARHLMARDGSVELDAGDLRYVRAEHAFVDVVFVRDGERSHRLLRVAMPDAERQFPAGSVLRCHASWLVAVDAIAGAQGDAQGLRLVLRDVPETVPVSRTRAPAVKALLTRMRDAAPVADTATEETHE